MTTPADATPCAHLSEIDPNARARTEGCEECEKTGDDWLALSVCLTCGHVGCCYDSKGQHAWKHYEETQHPIIAAFKRRSEWRWCYPDDKYV